jgi:hypothetical protein
VVTAEVRRFLESDALQRQVWKILTGITLEVNATIQLKPSGEPGIKVAFKRSDGEKADKTEKTDKDGKEQKPPPASGETPAA